MSQKEGKKPETTLGIGIIIGLIIVFLSPFGLFDTWKSQLVLFLIIFIPYFVYKEFRRK